MPKAYEIVRPIGNQGLVVPSLIPNIKNRVRKLPKPSTHSQGLQPLFEAVSNAFYAIEDRFGDEAASQGRVIIDIQNLGDSGKLQIDIWDNGIGFDDVRFEAFCTVDTDHKRARGGKGVGRLFWLDAFSSIEVTSAYSKEGTVALREFRFELSDTEQVVEAPYPYEAELNFSTPGTLVRFRGLRIIPYQDHFPKRSDTFARYFTAHFIADFLVGKCPSVKLSIDGEHHEFPREVADLVVGPPLTTEPFSLVEFGELKLTAYACRPETSTGLDGNHLLHLLANGRTVVTRKIDGLIGLDAVEAEGQAGLFLHACVAGDYLDDRVNEGRTAFNVPENVLKTLTRDVVGVMKEKLIAGQISEFVADRRKSFEQFIQRHPIYAFEDADVQLDRIPFAATKAEDFAAGLVKYQIRRDEQRQDAMENVIRTLDGIEDVPENFAETVVHAAENLQASERLSLAQHVVRRKLVLDLMEKLIRRIRSRSDRGDTFHLERTLHSFICPMNVRGDEAPTFTSRSHDLWIIDERLAFTRAFASDKRLDKVLTEGGSADRPDLFVWNLAYGMGVVDPCAGQEKVNVSEPLQKVLIVEFKRPGRTDYQKAEDQVEAQIVRYLAQLKGNDVESFSRERIRIAPDCIFYCYVVADIVGDLEIQLSTWQTTANGQGRIRALAGSYRGSIEVVQWQDLINDAWMRNQATLHAAGLRRS